MRNIVLVQTHDLIVNRYLPLAVSNIWLYAQKSEKVKNSYRVRDVVIDKVDTEKYIADLDFVPDIFAFSVYVWNWKHTKEFAKSIKKRFPKCKIIVGGPQIPKSDKDFFKVNDFFDIAVLGEGEIAFRHILENHCKPLEHPNVFYKGMPLPNSIDRVEKLDDIPSPILSGFYDGIIKKYNKKYKDVKWGVIYETMRGCPYHCAFCDIGDQYYNKAKQFHISRVYKEIDWMSKNKIEYVSVADSNWGIFERDLDISKYVIYNKLKHGYPKHWDVSFAKNNYERVFKIALHDKLKDSKIFKGVTFAYQSTDVDVLKAIDRFNIDAKKSKEMMDKFAKNEIAMYSELVFPLPMDTIDTLKNSIEDVIKYGQKGFLMVHPTAVTPNASLNNKETKEKHRINVRTIGVDTFGIISDNEKDYEDNHEMIVSTNTLSESEHVVAYCFAWAMITMYYYGWAHYIIEYLVKKTQKKYTEIVQDIIDHALKYKNNIFYKEYMETKKHITKVLKNKTGWNRDTFKDGNLMLEPKAASSSIFLSEKQDLFNFLKSFLIDFGIPKRTTKQLITFSENACFDFRKTYPIQQKFEKQFLKDLCGLQTDIVTFNHYDMGTDFTMKEFCRKAYHWQRKNQYWKCTMTKSQ